MSASRRERSGERIEELVLAVLKHAEKEHHAVRLGLQSCPES